MFERLIDWTKVVGMISDITKGTSTVSLRRYAKPSGDRDRFAVQVFGWDYHRVQARAGDTQKLPALVNDGQLTDVLSSLCQDSEEEFYAYEVDGADRFEKEARILLQEFGDIAITTVKLSVGDVDLGWFLVLFENSRDVVHWKMKYHGRKVRPAVLSSS